MKNVNNKVCILGDLHLASKNGSAIYSKHQQKFFDNVLFPYLEKTGYSVWQLGDLFDQRKYVSFVGLDAAKRGFFDKLPTPKYGRSNMITILGNHDISYKETLRVNSPELLISDYCYTIVTDPITIDGCDFIPWIVDSNRNEIYEFIKKSKSRICCGHFEISGFSMQRGIPSHGGLDITTFDKYDLVLSGHFHTRSSNGNITYVGTPYELTWADHKDPKGFHVLDIKTLEMEFIENPYTLYESIQYDDRVTMPIDFTKFAEKYVKVIVINKTDYYAFDQFINQMNNAGAYDIKIIENFNEQPVGEIGEEIVLQDTLHVLSSYVSSLNVENVDALNTQMKSLYLQAQEIM